MLVRYPTPTEKKERRSHMSAQYFRAWVESLEARQLLSVGDLNLAFGGGDGRVRNSPPVTGGAATQVVAQSNGKFVVGGTGTKSVFLERLDAQGNLDTSFGTNGVFTIANGGAGNFDFARQSDGSYILIFGKVAGSRHLLRQTRQDIRRRRRNRHPQHRDESHRRPAQRQDRHRQRQRGLRVQLRRIAQQWLRHERRL